jgi:hypothetical protein
MSDNMADGGNIGIVVSVGTLIGSIITFITFWTRFSDRITIADQKAGIAQQEAAEAKNDLANFREALDEMTRDLNDRMEQMRREDGDSLNAIRQHVTEVGFYMRDNFVRNDVFAAAMIKIEAGQLRAETKLDRLSEQMRGG